MKFNANLNSYNKYKTIGDRAEKKLLFIEMKLKHSKQIYVFCVFFSDHAINNTR